MTSVAANLLFNGLTYRRLGATGLALGTTVGALVNLAVLPALVRPCGRPRLADRAVSMKWSGWLSATSCSRRWRQGLGGRALWLLTALASRGPWGTRRLATRSCCLPHRRRVCHYGVGLKLLRLPGAEEIWDLPKRIWRG